MRLEDLDLLKIGHTIQLYGAIYQGEGRLYLLPLPDEDPMDIPSDGKLGMPWDVLEMGQEDWTKFLKQSDVLDIQGPGKAILRKSQRQIDQNISWTVFRRDGYACRYCGRADVPLTVDHVILWEEGGATVPENLISACRRCNKLRGNMPYDEWVDSRQYISVSKNLWGGPRQLNKYVVGILAELRSLSVAVQRSR